MPYKDPDIQRSYQKHWMRMRRKEFISKYTCPRCLTDEHLKVSLPHVVRSKKGGHTIWSYAIGNREKLLKDAKVYCSKCHMDVSSPE